MSENEKKKLLEIKDLKIYYPIKGKRDAEGKPAYVKAVDGVTFDVYERTRRSVWSAKAAAANPQRGARSSG